MPPALWRRPGTSSKSTLELSVVCALLAGVLAGSVGWPALYTLIDVAEGAIATSASPPRAFFGPGTSAMLLRTLVAAAAVSGVAVVLAYPIAWALRSRRAFLPLLVLPMFVPSYVSYAGWGVLRAPQTVLGNWLAQGSIEQSELKVRWAYDIQAVLGLSLWAWPVAAIILGTAIHRLSPDMLESLRLESTSVWRKRVELVSMTRWAIVWAFGIVFVLMLGSAVPFHVAQLETYAIAIWRLIDLTAPPDRWRVWVAALPLVAVTLGAGAVLVRRSFSLSNEAPAEDQGNRERRVSERKWTADAYFGTVWVLSVIVPAGLLATSLRSGSSIMQFFRENTGKVFDSLATACAVACIAWIISTSIWFVARRSRNGNITAKVCVAASLLIAPVPGLLIGLATSRAWNSSSATSFVADTSLIVILVHTARFAFIPVLVGWWLAHTENRSLFDLSRIDGAETFVGWFRACYRTNAWPTIAAAVAVALLSFQEIEASIMVVPAGYGSMSQWMLQQLHYLRQDALAAGVLFMLVPALVAALTTSWWIHRSQSKEESNVVSSGRST